MRSVMAAALCTSLLAMPGRAQHVEKVAAGRNVLTAWLDEANIHPPVHLGRLTIFPVTLDRVNRLANVLTMDQALQKGLLAIEELQDAQVSRARFINKSGKHFVFLMAGEVITGGKQNRTLATDALLGPDSATVLPLYCVERGRWTGPVKFDRGSTIAPQAIRERAAQGSGQGEVWRAVTEANTRLRSATDSEDLAAAMTKPENIKQLRELRGRIRPKLPSGCAGVVVARHRNIVGADLFNSPELFEAMQEKILDSYTSHYLNEASAEGSGVSRPSQQDARDYLQGCYEASFTSAGTRGVGELYDIRGPRHGQTLAYDRPYRHPAAEDEGMALRRAEQYMIHTALMQRVVPVRPVPIPMPEPPQPRRR